MKNLFRLKGKLHYLLNCAFYLIFFIIGFLLGGGKIEKISDIFNNFFN